MPRKKKSDINPNTVLLNLQERVGKIETHISWMKEKMGKIEERVEKVEKRLWWILGSVLGLGLLGIFLRLIT